MEPILPLASLGQRIMIMGPSNAGKSTLAVATGARLGIPVHHIDTLRHLPHTDWIQRPTKDFHALHQAVVDQPTWILEGNYSEVIPPRIARATGIILADDTLLRRYIRYFRRTLFERERAGALEGTKDSVKWAMVHWLWHTRHSIAKYRRMAKESGLPCVFVRHERELQMLYEAWGLTRPSIGHDL
jgi:adenylate kinase family enzyme